jgi:hypothetical protein
LKRDRSVAAPRSALGATHGDGGGDVRLTQGRVTAGGGPRRGAGGSGEFGPGRIDALFKFLHLANQATDLVQGAGGGEVVVLVKVVGARNGSAAGD